MKIVHIAPNAPYNDYWGYQENILPKYQRKMGHDVTVIVTNQIHKDGKIEEIDCSDYFLDDGVRVIRLKKKKYPIRVLISLNSKLKVLPYLEAIKPDFIFYHGLHSATIFEVIDYKKHINPKCVIVQDNHSDYFNNGNAEDIKGKLIRTYHRIRNKRSIHYISKVYGVTPWRQKYAQDYFCIPECKTDVLIMGADEEKIDFDNRDTIRQNIRNKYGVSDSDYLIVTGGKIDKNKNIDLLIQACSNIDGVKLLVFGSLDSNIKNTIDRLLESSPNATYIGWVEADKVYDYFLSADLVCFPGTHSVMWEQACACRVPCLFKLWEGMEHVNNGGNSAFVSDVTVNKLYEKIVNLRYTEEYERMKMIAGSCATNIYLYSNIAHKSLECAIENEDF